MSEALSQIYRKFISNFLKTKELRDSNLQKLEEIFKIDEIKINYDILFYKELKKGLKE